MNKSIIFIVWLIVILFALIAFSLVSANEKKLLANDDLTSTTQTLPSLEVKEKGGKNEKF